jgi:hypothetical protein
MVGPMSSLPRKRTRHHRVAMRHQPVVSAADRLHRGEAVHFGALTLQQPDGDPDRVTATFEGRSTTYTWPELEEEFLEGTSRKVGIVDAMISIYGVRDPRTT